jgi:type I restriction enzyme S subunit
MASRRAFLHSCILALVQRATHGTCKLQSDKLFAFRFGLPLVAEQHRIVAKVDELMALCDRLQANLIEFRARQSCGWPVP